VFNEIVPNDIDNRSGERSERRVLHEALTSTPLGDGIKS
jgi:hypothetical protein